MNIYRPQKKDEQGQALTEFVVVMPVIVILLLFAIWLTELTVIRLKVQEAARFAAWESTTYKLHDYKTGDSATVDLGLLEFGSYFTDMQVKVSAYTMAQYANLDSSILSDNKHMMMASWEQPIVAIPADCNEIMGAVMETYTGMSGLPPVCGNLVEPLVIGGPWAQLAVGIGASIYSYVKALTYAKAAHNVVALAMIGIGGGNAFFGGTWSTIRELMGFGASDSQGMGGGLLASVLGSDAWEFNTRGYVRAVATVTVHNDWLNFKFLGAPLFERPKLVFSEQHAVLADSWRLNNGEDVPATHNLTAPAAEASTNTAGQQGSQATGEQSNSASQQSGGQQSSGQAPDADEAAEGTDGKNESSDETQKRWFEIQKKKNPTSYHGSTGFWQQLNRMYMGRPQARRVGTNFINLFRNLMLVPARITGIGIEPFDSELWAYPTIAAWNYGRRSSGEIRGPIPVKEDTGDPNIDGRWYHTAPNVNEYAKTRMLRGEHFMGCREPQQLGCTDTVSQENPLGDYVRRNSDPSTTEAGGTNTGGTASAATP